MGKCLTKIELPFILFFKRSVCMKRIGIYGTVIDVAESSTSMDELVRKSGLTSAQITASLNKKQLKRVYSLLQKNKKCQKNQKKHKILCTLRHATFSESGLEIKKPNDYTHRQIIVVSNNREYINMSVKLHVGDDIFICTKQQKSITFAHYTVHKLSPEENAYFIYGKHIYKKCEISCLPCKYQRFVRDFLIYSDMN